MPNVISIFAGKDGKHKAFKQRLQKMLGLCVRVRVHVCAARVLALEQGRQVRPTFTNLVYCVLFKMAIWSPKWS